ncbi:MAG: NAD(P)H-dependent oxidoreductase [Chitinophagaceae bacterium]|nr:NAD(P)H-dependent oxidoreductase [Chitinophagaceae bacterium]
MAKILILFAHPALEKSKVHKTLLKHVGNMEDVYVNDLYEAYPEFDIDVEREQRLLLSHDIIIFQHPFYWYSAPALLKQWQDLVLEHGWAYGKTGNRLAGKKVFNVISTGGSLSAYGETGRNRYTIRELLRPFEQTAYLCKMEYLPPFVVADAYKIDPEEVRQQASHYQSLLTALKLSKLSGNYLAQTRYLNDIIPAS